VGADDTQPGKGDRGPNAAHHLGAEAEGILVSSLSSLTLLCLGKPRRRPSRSPFLRGDEVLQSPVQGAKGLLGAHFASSFHQAEAVLGPPRSVDRPGEPEPGACPPRTTGTPSPGALLLLNSLFQVLPYTCIACLNSSCDPLLPIGVRIPVTGSRAWEALAPLGPESGMRSGEGRGGPGARHGPPLTGHGPRRAMKACSTCPGGRSRWPTDRRWRSLAGASRSPSSWEVGP
jgi:hypothetical protein